MSEAKKKRWQDKGWAYTPANATDISKTFARIRRQMKQAEAAKKPGNKVTALPPKKGSK